MSSLPGIANNFQSPQCTYWADERYHQLTGYYVPFNGNAADWARNCLAYGWVNSSSPVIPSIMCFQPGIQQANSAFGHVAVAESINGNGTIHTSNMNYGNNPTAVTYVDFSSGYGVSFIYAVDSKNKPLGSSGSTLTPLVSTSSTNNNSSGNTPIIYQLSPNANVSDFLVELDLVMELVNPFDVDVQQDTIGIPPLSISFGDPVDYIHGVLVNLFDDVVAIQIRFIFFVIGIFIVIKVIGAFVDYGKVASSIQGGIETVGKVAALAG